MCEESMYIKCIQPVDLHRPFKKGKTYKARSRREYGKRRWEVESEKHKTIDLRTITIGDINIYTNFDGGVFMADEDIDALAELKKVKIERKPLLILGSTKRDDIDRYLEKVLCVDSRGHYGANIEYYPRYYNEADDTPEETQALYEYYIDCIRLEKPFAVVPTTLGFIDALLNSDLEFKIVKISEYVREINVESFTKEELLEKGKDSNFDPRD